jgi:N-acetylglucosaminyl-diphospho-decaprenol L-rhamnosyltransferase
VNIVVIIVAYKGDQWIPKCVESIRPSRDHQINLLLVDNFDTPCLASIEKSGINTTILKTPSPLGFAEANNYALVNGGIDSDVVVLLNQDTWSESDWIPTCADILAEQSDIHAISPMVRQYEADDLDPNFETCLREDNISSPDNPTVRIQKLPAVALAIRSSLLKETGPFDPIFGSYYEDYDLCRRIRNAGGTLAISTNAWVRHFSGSASTTREAKTKRMIQIIRNRLIHDLRDGNARRPSRLIRHFLYDLPKNLARGIMQTASSQPVAVTLDATKLILGIIWRISSDQRDRDAWHRYLHEIEWENLNRNSKTLKCQTNHDIAKSSSDQHEL